MNQKQLREGFIKRKNEYLMKKAKQQRNLGKNAQDKKRKQPTNYKMKNYREKNIISKTQKKQKKRQLKQKKDSIKENGYTKT